MFELDPIETRILGCLLEKQRTTPDVYPLTLNALRLACNQSTNRDPVMNLDEIVVYEALQRLHRRELTRVASGHGSRAAKYRHLLAEKLALPEDQSALLCVLLLRGEQTPGELKQRCERLHRFETLEDVDAALLSMAESGLVERLERRPGEKQVRWRQLLSANTESSVGESRAEVAARSTGGSGLAADEAPHALRTPPAIAGLSAEAGNGVAVEIAELRATVERLAEEVAEIRERLERGERDERREHDGHD